MENTLEITKQFAASINKVWAAWTDPAEVAKWFGPEGMETKVYKMDAKEGGEYRFGMQAKEGESTEMDSDGNEHVCFGIIKKMDADNHELQMTWGWEDPKLATTDTFITIKLEEKEGGTQMHFTHSGFAHEKIQEEHSKGWTSSFVALEKYLG